MGECVAQVPFAQVVKILIKCYENGVVRRDIKDENRMFDESGKLTLFRLGCAAFVNVKDDGDGKLRKLEATRTFSPPEWLESGIYYAEYSTVWQLGSPQYDMLNGDLPFHNEPAFLAAHVVWRRHVSSTCCGIVHWRLRLDPLSRPSLTKIAVHERIKLTDGKGSLNATNMPM